MLCGGHHFKQCHHPALVSESRLIVPWSQVPQLNRICVLPSPLSLVILVQFADKTVLSEWRLLTDLVICSGILYSHVGAVDSNLLAMVSICSHLLVGKYNLSDHRVATLCRYNNQIVESSLSVSCEVNRGKFLGFGSRSR